MSIIFVQSGEKRDAEDGLPRQSADWLAMTPLRGVALVRQTCVGAGFYPARNIVQKRREGQSPSPTHGFTKAQTKIISPSVSAKR